jgi:hypothetical protein
MLKKSILSIVLILSAPFTASAAQVLLCTETHSTEAAGGDVQSEHIANNAQVIDNGNSFTFSPNGASVTSPMLKGIKTPDGGQIFSARTLDGMVFAKFSDSYVYSDCKPASAAQ